MHRLLFRLGYKIKRPEVLKSYNFIKENEKLNNEQILINQERQLRKMIKFVESNVPYYKSLFSKLGIEAEDIKTVKDLEILPILTKKDIKNDPEGFIPANYTGSFVNGSTGGSTGAPLKYRMSKEDSALGAALLYRGFEYAGYSMGEKISIIAGSSLVSKNQTLKGKMQDYIMNYRHYSSYGMKDVDFLRFFNHLNSWKPSYLRGYASSLYLLSKYLERNQLELSYKLKGIFSTAEMLLPNQRKQIQKVFKTKVFNNYGLHDGGLTAFECSMHSGMHIDFDRSILEIVNDNNQQIYDNTGKIIATNLYNYAMPLIRYDTGDTGVYSTDICPCGCLRPLLKDVFGRTTDYLKLNGSIIGSPVLTVLMGKVDLQYYQIVQKSTSEVDITIVKGKNFDNKEENFIKNSLIEHVGNIQINFKEISETQITNKHKHKFIINEVCK